MADEQTAPETQPEPPKAETPPQEDLVTRASKVNVESKGPAEETSQQTFFDPKKIDSIQDPTIKAQVQATYDEMNKGLQAKFQEAAQQRKDAQAQQDQGWTPERLAAQLKRDDFLSSAQYLNSQQTTKNQSGGELNDQEWSALTPEERTQMMNEREKVKILTNEVTSMRRQQEDDRLKAIYANYDPAAVTKLQGDLYNGRYQAGPEDIWKVHDYEAMAKRSYQLGMQDAQNGVAEKANAISPGGLNATPTDSIPAREPKETGPAYFVRLAQRRVAELARRK